MCVGVNSSVSFLYSQWRMNGGGIVLLVRDHDLLCEREAVGDSRKRR